MSERSGTAMPTPPDDIVEAARLAPDHWISMIDPGWDGEGVPPDRVVVGRWRTGATGEIEEWEDNEAYRPSPESLGWPEPTDDVDKALQLAVTGYGPAEDVLRALATAEVAVLTLPDGSPVTAAVEDGGLVVPVFTAPSHLAGVGGFAFERVTVPALLDRLPPGHALYVNPAGPAGSVLEPGRLAGTVTGGTRPDGAEPSAHDTTG
ncbi:type VII secretion system-associated protein [Streptomyces sp. Tu 3180]|uniref:type VII secretion system-associated protein n=1 Tax=Streptomyces sp. Tu 3180 TaxID=2682611 RepID=UPI001357A3E2|nr:type VII secretion system-associated protein [Streptomyces sp. Tu 3180]KAF3467612.1 SseB family protein [Streptomyces sp. Tu 3180]